MSIRLYRLARWCFLHHRIVAGVWLTVVVAAVLGAVLSGGKTQNVFTIPGTESQQVTSILERKLPAMSGGYTQVVFSAGSAKITSASSRAAVERALQRLARMPQVVAVTSPYQTKLISADQRAAIAMVYYDAQAMQVKSSTVDLLWPAVASARAAGVDVNFSGSVYPQTLLSDAPEAIGVVVALVILIVNFGSLLAAGIPLLSALLGVLTSMMGIMIVAALTTVSFAATTVALMLGISCGIDYALFVLTRYRQYLLAGELPAEAAGRAAGTAGSAVVFAALSVIIALSGLSVVGIPFLTLMGLSAAGSVLIALLMALTLLPAVFGLIGKRAIRFSRLRLLRHVEVATHAAVDDPQALRGTRWVSWVTRHHGAVLALGVAGLLALASPVLGLSLGLPSSGSQPQSSTARRAYDTISTHFGVGYNGMLVVLAEHVAQPAEAERLLASFTRVSDVKSVQIGALKHGLALFSVVPDTGPNSAQTMTLVHYIRAHRTALATGAATDLLVGGMTAANIDMSAKLAAALPVFLAVVVGLAFLLLTFAFRTFFVPLKSILGFLFSIGAALGAQVAIFQWGWLASLLGITPSQTLSFLPILLLAIIFGLSSDYEVFVVSRIKEQFTREGDARAAVVGGAGASARVVTAAALIMAAVFASFILSPDPMIKSIGFSFSFGVLVDAFVVRLTLVPAVMSLLGDRIWWAPRWFARVPDPDIEGQQLGERLIARRSHREARPRLHEPPVLR
jgi:RND superfamily putative drug exporter